MTHRIRRATFAAALLLSTAAAAGEAPDPHAHCKELAQAQAQAPKRAARTTAAYPLPAVELVREDGRDTTLAEALGDDRPVVIDFVYTTCTTICPVLSGTFTRLQSALGADAAKVRLVSISIDPEQDTPARLAAYARRFHAQAGWHFYTGSAQASVAVQRAFQVYRGDKMDHTPVTLLRPAAGRPWVRFDGFAAAEELAAELRPAVASR
jgi:protein SCO1/2